MSLTDTELSDTKVYEPYLLDSLHGLEHGGAEVVFGQPLGYQAGHPGANRKSISHRCHPFLVAFVWDLT